MDPRSRLAQGPPLIAKGASYPKNRENQAVIQKSSIKRKGTRTNPRLSRYAVMLTPSECLLKADNYAIAARLAGRDHPHGPAGAGCHLAAEGVRVPNASFRAPQGN